MSVVVFILTASPPWSFARELTRLSRHAALAVGVARRLVIDDKAGPPPRRWRRRCVLEAVRSLDRDAVAASTTGHQLAS
jgi:hypothetical protein